MVDIAADLQVSGVTQDPGGVNQGSAIASRSQLSFNLRSLRDRLSFDRFAIAFHFGSLRDNLSDCNRFAIALLLIAFVDPRGEFRNDSGN